MKIKRASYFKDTLIHICINLYLKEYYSSSSDFFSTFFSALGASSFLEVFFSSFFSALGTSSFLEAVFSSFFSALGVSSFLGAFFSSFFASAFLLLVFPLLELQRQEFPQLLQFLLEPQFSLLLMLQ